MQNSHPQTNKQKKPHTLKTSISTMCSNLLRLAWTKRATRTGKSSKLAGACTRTMFSGVSGKDTNYFSLLLAQICSEGFNYL